MSEEVTLTIKKDALWKYSTFALLAVLVIGGIVWMLPNNSSPTGNVEANNPAPTLPSQPSQVRASADDDPVLGNKNAPVEIIEFSDYQCPFCRKFWTETLPLIKSEYIDTGKVKFVYRDFPLDSIHPAATPAAEAANCVREQGGDEAYYEMHDKIFQEGNILDGGDPITGPVRGTAQFGATELKQWAQDIGYDIGSCLDSGKYKSEVQKDLADAQAAGGQGTPYFVINGKPLSGAQPFAAFKQVIDAELA
ncbi:DsbA family protein [Candidatus Pacearchaeota archaeon]|nr:DsbA family protein [Candidatus Pacearchaeota archaeon]